MLNMDFEIELSLEELLRIPPPMTIHLNSQMMQLDQTQSVYLSIPVWKLFLGSEPHYSHIDDRMVDMETAWCCVLELVRKQFAEVVAPELIAGIWSFVGYLLIVDPNTAQELPRSIFAKLSSVSSLRIAADIAELDFLQSKFPTLSFEDSPRVVSLTAPNPPGSGFEILRFAGLFENLASAAPMPTLLSENKVIEILQSRTDLRLRLNRSTTLSG
jgi:hypothetical protein